MIREIQLKNYRGFKNHTIPLRQTSVIVGSNNAGKSTIIEALNLVSIVVSRATRARFRSPPDWLDIPINLRGISPSLKGIDFEYRNICYRYEEPPAIVRAKLSNNITISIYLDSEYESLYAVIRKVKDNLYNSSLVEKHLSEIINVLPPVGRLRVQEESLSENYVRSNINSRLASLHFRNQIHLLRHEYDETRLSDTDEYGQESHVPILYEMFVRLAETSWPHLRVESLSFSQSNPPLLNLLVRDGPFVAEVGWVGSGLQAWLQTCWFLSRCPRQSVVVLDEPDVFLHPDLQRRLFRLVEGYFDQVLIATHSTEVLAEVDPGCVLVVDKDSKGSKFAENIPAVQNVINNIGGAHNLQLTRLWSARKCIFIEGDDLDFLSVFHEKIFPESLHTLNSVPSISINGAGNWKHAVGAAIGLRNAGDQAIKAFCILDSDYRTDEQHAKIFTEASANGLNLHIWDKKEIENYVIKPDAISRFIKNRAKKKFPCPNEIRQYLGEICNSMKDEVFDVISNEIGARDRKGTADANKKARKLVKDAWCTYDDMLGMCPGKTVISILSAWSQKKFGVSFGALAIAREMKLQEIPAEMIKVISQIEAGTDFSS